MATPIRDDAVNILLVDDQPAKLIAYQTILICNIAFSVIRVSYKPGYASRATKTTRATARLPSCSGHIHWSSAAPRRRRR